MGALAVAPYIQLEQQTLHSPWKAQVFDLHHISCQWHLKHRNTPQGLGGKKYLSNVKDHFTQKLTEIDCGLMMYIKQTQAISLMWAFEQREKAYGINMTRLERGINEDKIKIN